MLCTCINVIFVSCILLLCTPSPLPPLLPPSLSPPSLPAFLTSDSVDLQELAANSDRLLSTLVSYLGNQPDENDEFVEEKHILAYERLKEVQ